jgi:hypothetical protein
LVDDAYKALQARYGPWRRRGQAPRFSDSEVITMALYCDLIHGGDEHKALHSIRESYRHLFPEVISSSRFNERRKLLAPLLEQVRIWLSEHNRLVEEGDRYRIIDSAPIALCTYARSHECRSLPLDDPSMNQPCLSDFIGYSAKAKAYFCGCRLVLTCTVEQMIDRWVVVPARPHDSATMGELLDEAHGLRVLADTAYRAPKQTDIWAEAHDTLLLAPPRSNSRQPWPSDFRKLVVDVRRRIESLFGVLTLSFHLERPGSRSWQGFLSRTATQLLGYTLCAIITRYAQAGMLTLTPN